MAANQKQKSGGRKSQPRADRETAASKGKQFADDMRHQVSDYVSQGSSQFKDMTRDHEGTAVVVALATGFGVGLLIGAALASSQSRPQTWRDRIAAEGIGRRFLERVEGLMPDAVTEMLHR